ncbi:hypothetical protein ADL21_05195 [Streptomyces albus subsp. albus]|nr:hypothetical protein ADL21_05195 [Streptomyces albus subsp. albus]
MVHPDPVGAVATAHGDFWGLLVIVFVLMIRAFRRHEHIPPAAPPAPATPERLLAERFARGEIDEEAHRDDAGWP